MKAVGVRDLKNRLSRYLDEVRRGEVVLVTDRGEVVAELRQPTVAIDDASPQARRLLALAAEGVVQPATRRNNSAPYPRPRFATDPRLVDAALDAERAQG